MDKHEITKMLHDIDYNLTEIKAIQAKIVGYEFDLSQELLLFKITRNLEDVINGHNSIGMWLLKHAISEREV